MASQTGTSSVEKKLASAKCESSEKLQESFGVTEASNSQNVALEPSRQPEAIDMEMEGLDSSARAEPSNGPKGEFYGTEPEASDQGAQSNCALDHIAEELEDFGGKAEAGGIGGQVDGPFAKEEPRQIEELDLKVVISSIGTEGRSPGEEVVEEGDEE
ncbi:hypothetical protein V491_01526 [Pseudogymnoascus sp. VKM F-3775]|nr:hypothetical protein V491_01526 [Pseudogymnoascus sp. VKM F-3775]